ncbi:MAG: DNA adenine methylase [Prevotella sp.]|nr:DNA adenine methylase [Prevotella sp.]
MEFNFRTLNYLGSKLRLLDFIEENVRKVTPESSGVCDLFAGSGCVSYKLSRLFPVAACDIQHYSRVICNALLQPCSLTKDSVKSFLAGISDENSLLTESFSPLIAMEEKAINDKNLELLTDIVEHGSLAVYNLENIDSTISVTQSQVNDKLMSLGLTGKESLITRYYGGVYFSYRQAVQIDSIMDAIRRYSRSADKNVLLAALLSTTSDIACTVGKHFAQPIKARDSKGNIKSLVYNKAIKDKTIDAMALFAEWLDKYVSLPKGSHDNTTFQGNYLECLNTLPDNVRTIYADPPYTRDHYSRFYHVLETMALDDIPEISTVKIHGRTHVSNGIYRKDRHQSPFCIRSKAPEAFEDMYRLISESNRNLLLSYSPYDETKDSHPRVVTISQLITWANKYFNHVEVVSAGHFTHNKLNSTKHFLESSNEAEVLIICTNN